MTIRVHDSLRRARVPLEPLEPGVVRMYVCGPTVYRDCHIGHLMGPVVFDTIARWLRARGYRVRFVNNITDIDDKIIDRAREAGEGWKDVAGRHTEQYLGFLQELGVETVTDYPHCTDYVPQMVSFVQDLVDADRAYETSDGVYYDVCKQEGYGKLSGRRIEDMQAGARVEASAELRHPADFVLWKKAKPGEPSWESPWGPGRPGWHIECSVMSSELLGSSFDIHGGGDDLKFPHHENEIAQSEAHGDGSARLWMHNGLVQYEGRKVSKSDPRMADEDFARQFQARWLIDHHGAPAVRFFLVRSPYGRPVDFGPDALGSARRGLDRLHRQLGPLLDEPGEPDLDELLARDLPEELGEHRARFCAAMDDDFNSGEAVAELFSIANAAKGLEGDQGDAALRLLRDLGRVLGLLRAGDAEATGPGSSADERLGAVLDAVLAVRSEARVRQAYDTADGVRDLLVAAGVAVHDGPQGSTWELEGTTDDILARVLDGALVLRREAREREDYATADGIRDRLSEAGVAVSDGADGSTWELA